MALDSQRQPLYVHDAQNLHSTGQHGNVQPHAFVGQPASAPCHNDDIRYFVGQPAPPPCHNSDILAFGNKKLTMHNEDKHSRNEIDFYEHFMVYTEWPRHCCCVDFCLPPAYVKQVIPKFRITGVQFSKDKPAPWKLGFAFFFFLLAAVLLVMAFLVSSQRRYYDDPDPTPYIYLMLLVCLLLGAGFLVWANISKGVQATFAVTGYQFSRRTSSTGATGFRCQSCFSVLAFRHKVRPQLSVLQSPGCFWG
eukprot:TRINITY_DN2269_c0_g1_i1.p1 TRINITY_DN2269_c0_g1~~TRINITY_DN2269_c0_g1_i1.p1  ORF type:complete len:250 (+),score=28.70 TRINITY_DN2269_c0_g1_i1:50-799(+)